MLTDIRYASSLHVDPLSSGVWYRIVAHLDGQKVFTILKAPEGMLDDPNLDDLMYAACREKLEAEIAADLPALLQRTARYMTLDEIETAVLTGKE